jgi:serine/threonine protein kinase
MKHTSNVGSLEYMAPEVVNGKEYSEKSDIYSNGVVMSKLFMINNDR